MLVALIMTLGSIVQGAVGFASGLIGVPLLVLCNFSLPEAATINLVSTSLQNVTGAWKLWPHLEKRELVLPVIVRSLALPFGTYAAYLANRQLNPAQSKQLVGVFLLVVVSLLLGLKARPREYLHWSWQVIAFSASGFLMGFAAIGGAPMVLYVNSLDWSAHKSRAFLFFCSAAVLPIAFASFWYEHGTQILPAVGMTLTLMPLILSGLWVGLKLGHQISKPLFRRVTYGLIIAIAVFSIATPFLANRTAGATFLTPEELR